MSLGMHGLCISCCTILAEGNLLTVTGELNKL